MAVRRLLKIAHGLSLTLSHSTSHASWFATHYCFEYLRLGKFNQAEKLHSITALETSLICAIIKYISRQSAGFGHWFIVCWPFWDV